LPLVEWLQRAATLTIADETCWRCFHLKNPDVLTYRANGKVTLMQSKDSWELFFI